MHRKKILWLVSWYPNKNDRYTGDFIQRHARAACAFNDIHVLFVTEEKDQHKNTEEINSTGLTEQIIYIKKHRGVLGRILMQFTWRNIFLKAVKAYISDNGLPDLVHVHVPWKAGIIALNLKRRSGLPYILTEHWGIYNEIVDDNFSRQPVYIQQFIKMIYAEAALFVSVSDFLLKEVKKRLGEKQSFLLPNVVDTTLFFPNEAKYSKFTFIHVSNMVPLKNVKGILSAFRQLVKENNENDFQLILIGNKDNEYVKIAEEYGLLNRSVFFKGEVLYREVSEEMKRCHCLVMNSIIENAPCVISEALCCGLPVIATKVGGIPEMVTEENGLVIPESNDKLLALSMYDMYKNYLTYDKTCIARTATKKYSYSTISEGFRNLYDTLLSKNNSTDL